MEKDKIKKKLNYMKGNYVNNICFSAMIDDVYKLLIKQEKEAQKEIIKKIEHSMSINFQSYKEMKLDGIDLKAIKEELNL